ncbi:hypothetical protein [uncultured Eudoraea sp.]|nr:hypothetical protein [uncultured Eudoraea sp.]
MDRKLAEDTFRHQLLISDEVKFENLLFTYWSFPFLNGIFFLSEYK